MTTKSNVSAASILSAATVSNDVKSVVDASARNVTVTDTEALKASKRVVTNRAYFASFAETLENAHKVGATAGKSAAKRLLLAEIADMSEQAILATVLTAQKQG